MKMIVPGRDATEDNVAETRPETIILDLDGTLIKHWGSLAKQMSSPVILLSGVREKLDEWERRGCRIVILTGRKKSMQDLTVRQLEKAGIFFDCLVMGVGGGRRVLINDCKLDGEETALAFTVQRNKGVSNVTF